MNRLLAATIAAAASLGVTHEGMLQDTFKSAIVACGALLAALVFVWPRRDAVLVLRWHPILLLPLMLAAYALASMAWAHPWLAGVEAVRWSLVALVAFLALQAFSDESGRAIVAWGVALGATVASLWVALQFFFALELFPQGARPASTFVNRNFFAEFAVCALPWFAWLVMRERRRGNRFLIALAAGVVMLAIGMTGARAALVALGLLLACALVAPPTRRWVLVALLPFVLLGTVPTGDARIAAEKRGDGAVARVFARGAAIASGDEATTMRLDMWTATTRTIADHPIAGVGAGSWESEADYFAHNEFLQLVAEYGIVGWLFLAALAVWLARQFRRLDPWRAALLASLGALFVVSASGFPWHLAATGAMFALCLGGLATPGRELRFSSIAASAIVAMALVLAAYVTVTAARAESRLARAARIALEIGGTSNPNDARWLPAKSEMLRLVDEGMRLHPHERLMTPIVADELARSGDWPNAIRIWEHVLRSHPDVVPILANVARGYAAIGRPDLAAPYAERAQQLRQMSSSKG